jgi:hypothetical protein
VWFGSRHLREDAQWQQCATWVRVRVRVRVRIRVRVRVRVRVGVSVRVTATRTLTLTLTLTLTRCATKMTRFGLRLVDGQGGMVKAQGRGGSCWAAAA